MSKKNNDSNKSERVNKVVKPTYTNQGKPRVRPQTGTNRPNNTDNKK